MLRSTKELWGYRILATDEDIGRVHDFFFDDERWILRYLVVDTGTWLPGRKVLISPVALRGADWANKLFSLKLSKEQVEKSPPVDTDKPVSRQKEMELHTHYGWAIYWPVPAVPPVVPTDARQEESEENKESDAHLRSTREVCGYRIQATDGEIGHTEDFIIEEESWTIRYMVVDTRNWLPGRKVIVSPQWIEKVSWDEKSVHVDLLREDIENSPVYDPSAPVNREVEMRLYDYYGRPRYWV
jgi:hypothetical protein